MKTTASIPVVAALGLLAGCVAGAARDRFRGAGLPLRRSLRRPIRLPFQENAHVA